MRMVVPSQKKFETLPGPIMRSYMVKENHIGSAVSKIIQYRQINIIFTLRFIK